MFLFFTKLASSQSVISNTLLPCDFQSDERTEYRDKYYRSHAKENMSNDVLGWRPVRISYRAKSTLITPYC